jgi:beta-mannanase
MSTNQNHPIRSDWHPGDDVVDIIGLDAYPKDQTETLVSK